MLVNKPVGLVVHCDSRQIPDTLINRVLHYLYENGAYQPEQEQSFTPALCNRLDRNTGGIVIAAKTAAALREVNRLIRENKVHKNISVSLSVHQRSGKRRFTAGIRSQPAIIQSRFVTHRKKDFKKSSLVMRCLLPMNVMHYFQWI